MNNKKRTLIIIICSILLIMPSFLGVPLANGNLVVIPTPDSGQVNDEISTNTDLNDDTMRTMITTEHLETAESDQSSQSYVVTEMTLLPQVQAPGENTSETTSFWPLIPSYSGISNATDSVGSLVGSETLPFDDVNSTILNDAPIAHDLNLTTGEDALLNLPSYATNIDEKTRTVVEQLDPQNGTPGVFTSNETAFTPIPDLRGVFTLKIEATHNELGNDTANGLYYDSLAINGSQPIFGTLAIDQNNTIIYTGNLASHTSDLSHHTITDGDGADTEILMSTTNAINQPLIDTANVASDIGENSPILIDSLANDFDADLDSLVVSSSTQGHYETDTNNQDENTAFSSEKITIEGSDLSSTDSVNIIVLNTNGGSSGNDDNNSNHAESDVNDDNDGQFSSNSVHDDGKDKGGAHDDEHHTNSESTHENEKGMSHKDSDHENREGSDDDRDHNDHHDD